jgi:hypothetical protein
MKIRFVLPLLFLLSMSAFAQTTYTTTADGCTAKASFENCTLPVIDQNHVASYVAVDTRGSYPNGTMYIGGWGLDPHSGVFAGLNGNPNGTHNAFYGAGSFESTDELVSADLQFYAYYVASCSGRGCSGTQIGWHFRFLAGSTIAVQ